jgi:hypothetical protein
MGQRASGGIGVVVRTRIISLAITMAVAGCATQAAPPILTPVEVRVPIATPVYCQVGKLDNPELPIRRLKADSDPDDTIRAYAATVAILKGAVRQRDLVIAGCAAPPVPQQQNTASPDETARSGGMVGKP